MRFIRKRGRPRKQISLSQQDHGTPELQQKRKQGATLEALDYCLKYHIIDEDHYLQGRRLAWLYRLRYGKTHVTAISLDDSDKAAFVERDERWTKAREVELKEALLVLTEAGMLAPVINLCVYNGLPPLLKQHPHKTDALREVERLQKGLSLLVSAHKHR